MTAADGRDLRRAVADLVTVRTYVQAYAMLNERPELLTDDVEPVSHAGIDFLVGAGHVHMA